MYALGTESEFIHWSLSQSRSFFEESGEGKIKQEFGEPIRAGAGFNMKSYETSTQVKTIMHDNPKSLFTLVSEELLCYRVRAGFQL